MILLQPINHPDTKGMTMREYIATTTQKGQVTIPQEILRLMNVLPGDTILFRVVDGTVQLSKVSSKLLAGFGAVVPLSENFQTMRKKFEKEVAREVVSEV
jgi:bifunctional DNA-binding transcriptional regulator/antitoxin component of YhaV-PrlF toxin-antitoxin module